MATVAVQITPREILIPRNAVQDWGEIEVIRTEQHIVLRPKATSPAQKRELAIQALREDGLLYETERKPDLPDISDQERVELAKRLAQGGPLSDVIIRERQDRV
jgi:hypothetical protein